MTPQNVSIGNAIEAWGQDMPLWVQLLAEACDESSQRKVSDRIGYSSAVVNQVIKNKYPGDMASVEENIRAVLMAEDIDCPAIGAVIELSACLEHQRHAKAGNRTNSFRASMARACPNCPNNRTGGAS